MTQTLAEGTPFQNGNEKQNYPETTTEAFREGKNAFYDLPFDESFLALCAERNISEDDTAKPSYWAAAADHSGTAAEAARAQGVPEKNIAITQLMASTPDFIYTQAYLNHPGHDRSNKQVRANIREAKLAASYYNGLLRDTAEAWPDLTANELATNLLNVANVSIEHRNLKASATNTLTSAIRGAQHEVAFGQLLEKTGRQYRGAEAEEDLRGIDYVVSDADGRNTQYIDVKASLHEVAARGGKQNMPYARAHDGKLTMYSMVTDQDLGGKFHVPDDIATEKAAYLDAVLREANNSQRYA